MSEYESLVTSVRLPSGWSKTQVNPNIPDHPVVIFMSPSGKYEVEISPVDGYDDGQKRPEDEIEYFVNQFEYLTYDEEHDEWIDSSQTASKRFSHAEEAVEDAQKRIATLAEN